MRNVGALLLVISSWLYSWSTFSQSAVPESVYKNLPFKMGNVSLPIFSDNELNIRDFGAIPDGLTLNSDAFEKALATLLAKGGGKLIIPAGIWLTGPITFQSNVNLHLEQGAVIVFSTDFKLYPLVETSYEGRNEYRCFSPINGKNLHDIAITGKGIIDGSGEAWRPVKRDKMTEEHWKKLVKSGGILNEKQDTWWPSKSALEGDIIVEEKGIIPKTMEESIAIKDFLRPVMVSFINCKNVWLDGITFQNSPAWTIHSLMCENLMVSNISARSPWYGANNDGIDIESSKNVVLYNCSFDVGDDGICVKSGRDEDGRKRAIPTENLIVSNCIVYHGHGGFVVGSEMSAGVKNIKVSNCTFWGTDVGIRFKSTRGRGGIVENIWISNINMKDIVTDALQLDLFYFNDDTKQDEICPVNETTPRFRNIFIENIVCIGANRAIFLNGLPEMNVQNLTLDNLLIKSEYGAEISNADGVKMTNVKIISKQGDPFKINKSINVTLNKKKL